VPSPFLSSDLTDIAPTLALDHASKAFGAIQALADVSIALYPGEAHALVGENGAGKSTLVKILGGVHLPDRGTLRIDGQPTVLQNPGQARDAGVAIIHQEPVQFPDLTVAENIFNGRQPTGRWRLIDRRAMHREAKATFERLGVPIDPERIARGLSIAEQQIVEIAKALSLNARVIVMDEPTAALSAVEVDRLFAVVKTLHEHGVAVLFISHRLDEVFALCQRVTVLRDGKLVMTSQLAGLTADDLVKAMVGRELESHVPHENAIGDPVLAVERLTREGVFVDISLEVKAGEIVALAGLVGAGRTEVANAIFGIDKFDGGRVTVNGKQLRAGSPTGAMAAGVGLVPEDRRQQGLVMEQSIARNIALASLRRLSRFGLIASSMERDFAADWATRLQVRYGRISNPMTSLSGGNQQKVVLAKWLGRQPSLLIVDEPTRGIDVGTKAEVHRLLEELAGDGVAILVISSELPEVLRLANRILVMREGRLVAAFDHESASEEAIVAAATGQAEAVAA
jgi:rhamnose transport system ATP-binding protein